MQQDLPSRCKLIKPFLAMELLERANLLEKSGRNILYMCVGEPDLPPHPEIKETISKALLEGKSYYSHSLGIIELREAIAEYYFEKYRVKVSPDQIVVSSGTSPLMLLIFSLLVERGRDFLLTDPCYACYPNYVNFFEGNIRYFKLSETITDYNRISDMIDDNVAGLIINSPSNPTGALLKESEIKYIASLPVNIVSDEIYHGLNYAGEDITILSFRADAFVINGFSKAFSMTGFRLGYAILPERYMRTIRSLHQNFIICAPTFVQWAGITALKHYKEIFSENRKIFDERRRFLLDGLENLRLKYWGTPEGAFYVLVDMRFLNRKSMDISMELLENYNLAVTPGIDFGANAEGFIRLSYATGKENIEKALNILSEFLKNQR